MKKFSLLIAVMLVLSVAVWAQGGAGGATGGAAGGATGAGSNDTMGTRPGTSPNAPATAPPDATQNPTGSGNNSTAPDRGRSHEKTVEGCLVQSGNDWFLATKNNKKFIRLSMGSKSSSDFSSFANQKVKIR